MNSQEILQLNREYTLFSWAAQGKLDPIAVDRAEGIYLWDTDGRRYMDFSSQLMNVNIGHGHPAVVQAIKDQSDRLLHMSGTDFYYTSQILLSQKLARLVTGTDGRKVYFGNSGAEAVEAAFKLARKSLILRMVSVMLA